MHLEVLISMIANIIITACILLSSTAIRTSSGQVSVPQSAAARLRPLFRGGQQSEDDECIMSELVTTTYEDEDSYDELEYENDGEEVQPEMNVERFDEQFMVSPVTSLYVSLGVMMISRKVDMFSSTIVHLSRFAFIAFLICQQLFFLFVRCKAKSLNNMSSLNLSNPLSAFFERALDGKEGNDVMRQIASSFLASKSTVVAYDLNQVKSMQSGTILGLLFMWLLHFRLGQVQPLLIQTITGTLTLLSSPLFQVYILGRNLERPYKANLHRASFARADEVTEKV